MFVFIYIHMYIKYLISILTSCARLRALVSFLPLLYTKRLLFFKNTYNTEVICS